MVDRVIRSIHLRLVLKDAELARKVKQLEYYGRKLLLIVVMLIGRLMLVYYQQISNCVKPV